MRDERHQPDSREPVTSGTPLYMAPEVLQVNSSTHSSRPLDLTQHSFVRGSSSDVTATAASRPRSSGWQWAAALALVGVAATIVLPRWFRPADAAAHPLVAHFTIGPPYTSGSWPRISPDGRFVVFGAIVEGRDRFWIRALDAVNGWPLMNTTANESPFWSPDGSTLCFFDNGKLKRIPVESRDAQPEILADAPTPHGGDWNGQTIVFGRDTGLFKVALDQNATVSQLTTMDASRGEFQHAWPAFLPDGRQFLFAIRSKNADDRSR
jgi:hypothetical protein